MVDLPSLRRKYGPVFVTTLENGHVVPWKLLSVGEYLEYSGLLETGVYARATIEDEIFQKCVVDEYTLEHLPELKAGTVSTVVQDIITNSGPTTISELNSTLDIFRMVATQAVHQTVSLIAQAFPAYKLEDIYNMKYSDFMLRLAQAESKLLQLGVLEQALFFDDPEIEAPVATASEEESKASPMDMYLSYLKQQGQEPIPVTKARPKTEQTVITSTDAKSLQMEMIGHEKDDNILTATQMLEDASVIYKDYIADLSSGKQLEIKTPEERLVEANKRAKQSEQSFREQTIAKKKVAREIEKKYAEIHKRHSAKKKK